VTIAIRQQEQQYEESKESSFPAKSRNLRISLTFAVKLVSGSFGSLMLAQDDNCFFGLYAIRADESR